MDLIVRFIQQKPRLTINEQSRFTILFSRLQAGVRAMLCRKICCCQISTFVC